MSRLKDFETLKSNKAFGYYYNRSPKKHVFSAIVFYMPGNGKHVGFTASKKVGNAVARNFAKRRLRAAFVALADQLAEGTYIFVAKKAILEAPFRQVEKDLRYALRKLGALSA